MRDKFHLITRNLQEVIGEEELKELIKKKKEISVYWGTMPTGSPHIAYFLPMLKVRDFLEAGIKVKILIADLHAALDGVSWELLEKREKYYHLLIQTILKSLGVDLKKLEFVKGSTIQLKPKYFEDLLRLTMISAVKEATKSASEVVKMGDNPKLGNLIYPLMQALDEEYLQVDMQFGGVDQRKIMVFARENLPKIGYSARIELMNPMIPGLVGTKMSSSIPGSKIDLLDDQETVTKKIKQAEIAEGNIEAGIIQFIRYVIFPVKVADKKSFHIERPEKFGGSKSYHSYEEFENDFKEKKIHPLDVKNALTKEVNLLLEPIRKEEKIRKLYREAYITS